jgi:phosphatidylserine/phosphatidylglycerophosphate/cardiolipin synthase-like enzyme
MMRSCKTLTMAWVLIWALLTPLASWSQTPGSAASAEVLGAYFSPPDNAAQAIISRIDQAKTEVLVQAYGFTHNGIARALVRATERGVKVRVIMDAKSAKTNRFVVEVLNEHRVPYRWDGKHAIAHNKVMIIDSLVVVTGSFNFTNSAQTRNAENVLILRSSELAKEYRSHWHTHWDHSTDQPKK